MARLKSLDPTARMQDTAPYVTSTHSLLLPPCVWLAATTRSQANGPHQGTHHRHSTVAGPVVLNNSGFGSAILGCDQSVV